jgi:hypothetical protein
MIGLPSDPGGMHDWIDRKPQRSDRLSRSEAIQAAAGRPGPKAARRPVARCVAQILFGGQGHKGIIP